MVITALSEEAVMHHVMDVKLVKERVAVLYLISRERKYQGRCTHF